MELCKRLGVNGSCTYSTDTDRDFVHKSIVPTDHFQKSLPHLKIPKLEETCERYLMSQSVLQTPAEHDATKRCVDKFISGEGKALHEDLVARDKQNKHTSFISEPWFDMYLSDRRPISLTHNPFIVFTDDPKPEYMNQLLRATNLVMSSLRFMKTFRANVLEPDVYHLNPKKSDTQQFRKFVRLLPKSISFYGAALNKAFPLDMSQYPNLFNSTRIPKHGKDELFTNSDAKHMLVFRKGHMYLFDAIDQDGYIIAPEVMMSYIKYILDDARPPNENPLGVLTTLNRDKWATIRTQLCNAGVMNEGYMKLVDSALFALVLDDSTPENPNEITRNFLHGDGTNRWFDKCFSLILTKDGRAAVNFEHSWGDGVAVLRYFQEVWTESTKTPHVHPSTVPANVDSDRIVQKLQFALDPKLIEYIQTAKTDFATQCSTLDVDHLEYFKYNKKFIKDQKLSPDSVLQLVIQLAYYKQFGKTAATYESCSTAAFKHGRTETVRSATPVTKKACEMIMNSSQPHSVEELKSVLKECSEYHSKLTKEAAMGQGWDRHLFAMRYYANKEGKPLPELYTDPAYTNINHIILSTSTLSHPSVVIGGFGAVTQNGYGVGNSFVTRCRYEISPRTYTGDSIVSFKSSLSPNLQYGLEIAVRLPLLFLIHQWVLLAPSSQYTILEVPLIVARTIGVWWIFISQEVEKTRLLMIYSTIILDIIVGWLVDTSYWLIHSEATGACTDEVRLTEGLDEYWWSPLCLVAVTLTAYLMFLMYRHERSNNLNTSFSVITFILCLQVVCMTGYFLYILSPIYYYLTKIMLSLISVEQISSMFADDEKYRGIGQQNFNVLEILQSLGFIRDLSTTFAILYFSFCLIVDVILLGVEETLTINHCVGLVGRWTTTIVILVSLASTMCTLANFAVIISRFLVIGTVNFREAFGVFDGWLFFINTLVLSLEVGVLSKSQVERRENMAFVLLLSLCTLVCHVWELSVKQFLSILNSREVKSWATYTRVVIFTIVIVTGPYFNYYLATHYHFDLWMLLGVTGVVMLLPRALLINIEFCLVSISWYTEDPNDRISDSIYYTRVLKTIFVIPCISLTSYYRFYSPYFGGIFIFNFIIITTDCFIGSCLLLFLEWKSFQKRRNLIKKMDLIPNATEEQVSNYENVCAVCLEELQSGKYLSCGHIFHTDCLRKWIQVKSTCPCCNVDLPDP